MNQNLTFGKWVNARRKALDLTQNDLARRVACARVTVQKIESGRLRPSRCIAERLIAHLGVRAEERAALVQWARVKVPTPCPSALATQNGSGSCAILVILLDADNAAPIIKTLSRLPAPAIRLLTAAYQGPDE